MPTAPGTIDLGEPGPGSTPDIPWWVPWRRWWSWHRRTRNRRAVTGTAVAALVLATATAAAADTGPALVPVLSLTADHARATGGRVYTVDIEPPETWLVTSYRLPDGARQWRTRLPARGGHPTLEPTGEVLGVATVHRSRARSATSLLDAATGRVLGTYPGTVLDAAAGLVYLSSSPAPETVTAVDAATGAVHWHRRLPWSARVAAGRLVAFDGATVRTYALDTGEPLDAATPDLPERSGLSGWTVVGSVAVLDVAGIVGRMVAGYDVPTLATLWRITDSRYHLPAACGEPACAPGVRPRPPVSGERATGPVGRSGGWRPAPGGAGHLVVEAEAAVAEQPREASSPERWLIDATTGERVAVLGRWQPAAGDGRGASAVVAAGDRAEVRVGRVRPDGSGVAPIAAVEVPRGSQDCRVTGELVVCLTVAIGEPAEVRAWRIPSWARLP